MRVHTTAFGETVDALNSPSLVKIDCEGGEYDILLNTPAAAFARIDEMRLEYHEGPVSQLRARLARLGFAEVRFSDDGDGSGYLWGAKRIVLSRIGADALLGARYAVVAAFVPGASQ